MAEEEEEDFHAEFDRQTRALHPDNTTQGGQV